MGIAHGSVRVHEAAARLPQWLETLILKLPITLDDLMTSILAPSTIKEERQVLPPVENKESGGINELSKMLIKKIFLFLPLDDIIKSERVCKQWCALCKSPGLWNMLILRDTSAKFADANLGKMAYKGYLFARNLHLGIAKIKETPNAEHIWRDVTKSFDGQLSVSYEKNRINIHRIIYFNPDLTPRFVPSMEWLSEIDDDIDPPTYPYNPSYAFSPVAPIIATVAKGTLRLWDCKGKKLDEMSDKVSAFPFAFSPDGTMIGLSGPGNVSGEVDKYCGRLWNLNSKKITLLQGHRPLVPLNVVDWPRTIAISTNNQWIAVHFCSGATSTNLDDFSFISLWNGKGEYLADLKLSFDIPRNISFIENDTRIAFKTDLNNCRSIELYPTFSK